MNGYLIPANTKKSMLIMGVFTHKDLYLLGGALVISLLLLLTLDISSLPIGLLAIAPGAIGVFLVFPVPNYHNVATIIKEIYTFYTSRRNFAWKGWCYKDEIKK